MAEMKDRRTLVAEWIRRFLSYRPPVTWFGSSSVMRAWAEATAGLVHQAFVLYGALLRRVTLRAASGDTLTALAAGKGADRLGTQHAKALLVLTPYATEILSIASGATDVVTVNDASPFAATDSVRFRNADGSVTETATVIAVVTGGGTETIEVATLTGSYGAGTDSEVLLRYEVPRGTEVTTDSGIVYETLEAVTVGDANPVLSGESTFVGLADKVWAEAQEAGASSSIDAGEITSFVTPIDDVRAVTNPGPSTGGADEETDADLRYRTAHYPTTLNQETLSWIEALAVASSNDVLRAIKVDTSTAGTMAIKVLKRNGGTFTTTELDEIATYLEARVRSYMDVEVSNITLTSVSVEAQITLDPDAELVDVWRRASSELAEFLDYRTWQFGQDVDEADLLSILNGVEGVATIRTGSFVPAADVSVDDDSLPTLVNLSLEDLATGDTLNASLAVTF